MNTMYFFWLALLCFIFGTGILCDTKFEKRQTLTSCSVDTFNCSNGPCIESSLTCDGRADCSDGSDETQNLCSKLIKSCPSFAFRCKYGACVKKSAKCNGENDCIDGSDENLPECRFDPQQSNGSNCQEDEFSCKNGQCIDGTYTCDGVRNCADGSDETSALCKTIQCSKYTFKCKYGACINKNYKCDGIKHCADGSDEEQCSSSSSRPSSLPSPTTIPSKIKPPSSTPPTNSKSKCVIPAIEGTIFSLNDTNRYTVLPPGTIVDQFRIVDEDCEAGYHKVDTNRFMVCTENGQWKPLVSDKLCLRRCPPMTSDSLDIRCTLNGKNVDCSNPSIPGTILRPSCKTTHSLPNGQIETPIELLCLSDGKWSGQLYRCIPYCGRFFTPNKVLILNGVEAQYGTAPWNVGIYRLNHNNTYDMICGGTLIAPNLVVSAAHCFWQEGLENRILINGGQYKIAVGKYKRDFSVVDNEFTQIIDVGLIYLNDGYYGSSGFHAQDIAIIVLPIKVKISNAVLPACIEWTKQFTIPNGSLGKIVGWGKTEMMIPSSKLLEAYLPYIDHTTCRNMYKNGFELFVTSDKFCAGSQSAGQGVHEGDSGAGLTYVHNSLSYLTGIVSVKDPNTNDSVAVFTDISYHIRWIREIYTNYTYASENTSRMNTMVAKKK